MVRNFIVLPPFQDHKPNSHYNPYRNINRISFENDSHYSSKDIGYRLFQK